MPSVDERAKLAAQLGVDTLVIFNWSVSIQLMNWRMLTVGPKVPMSHGQEGESHSLGARLFSLQSGLVHVNSTLSSRSRCDL